MPRVLSKQHMLQLPSRHGRFLLCYLCVGSEGDRIDRGDRTSLCWYGRLPSAQPDEPCARERARVMSLTRYPVRSRPWACELASPPSRGHGRGRLSTTIHS